MCLVSQLSVLVNPSSYLNYSMDPLNSDNLLKPSPLDPTPCPGVTSHYSPKAPLFVISLPPHTPFRAWLATLHAIRFRYYWGLSQDPPFLTTPWSHDISKILVSRGIYFSRLSESCFRDESIERQGGRHPSERKWEGGREPDTAMISDIYLPVTKLFCLAGSRSVPPRLP